MTTMMTDFEATVIFTCILITFLMLYQALTLYRYNKICKRLENKLDDIEQKGI